MTTAQLLHRHRARQSPAQRWAEIAEDVAPFVGMSPDEHDQILQAVVRAAHQLLIDHPRELRPEPPAPDFRAIWDRLRARRHA